VAIEHGASCLVLTGNLYPNDTITARAREKGVPILVAGNDTFTVAKTVEKTVGHLSLENEEKIAHGLTLVKSGLDFDHLYRMLDLI
jgi:BioD-like phosphotransacetylase family protein